MGGEGGSFRTPPESPRNSDQPCLCMSIIFFSHCSAQLSYFLVLSLFIVLLAVFEFVMSSFPAARPGWDTLLSHYCDFFYGMQGWRNCSSSQQQITRGTDVTNTNQFEGFPISHVMVPKHALEDVIVSWSDRQIGEATASYCLSRLRTVWCLFFIHRYIDQS